MGNRWKWKRWAGRRADVGWGEGKKAMKKVREGLEGGGGGGGEGRGNGNECGERGAGVGMGWGMGLGWGGGHAAWVLHNHTPQTLQVRDGHVWSH